MGLEEFGAVACWRGGGPGVLALVGRCSKGFAVARSW